MNEKKKITITLTTDAVEILEKKCEQLKITKSEYINKIIISTNNAGRKEKLSNEQKEQIIKKHNIGVPISKLAREYKISRNLIYKIIEK